MSVDFEEGVRYGVEIGKVCVFAGCVKGAGWKVCPRCVSISSCMVILGSSYQPWNRHVRTVAEPDCLVITGCPRWRQTL